MYCELHKSYKYLLFSQQQRLKKVFFLTAFYHGFRNAQLQPALHAAKNEHFVHDEINISDLKYFKILKTVANSITYFIIIIYNKVFFIVRF